MERPEKALQKKREIGQESDKELLQYLKDNPASTIYEISKGLNWSIGKAQGSIARIKDQLVVEQVVENGRVKRKYDFPE
jgi:predicted HTH transcriptional regulator